MSKFYTFVSVRKKIAVHFLTILTGAFLAFPGPLHAIEGDLIKPPVKPEATSETAQDQSASSPGFFGKIGAYLGLSDSDSDNDKESPDQRSLHPSNKTPSNEFAETQRHKENQNKIHLYDFEAALKAREANPPIPSAPLVREGISPISQSDKKLYKRIFQLQANGNWAQANDLSEQLEDIRLRGHYLYQRYMHPNLYHSSFEELKNWMRLYADHPQSENIYKLALARKPDHYKGHLPKPQTGGKIQGVIRDVNLSGRNYKSLKKRSTVQTRAVHNLEKQIHALTRRGAPTRALNKLSSNKSSSYMDMVEYDRARGEIAQSYYHAGLIDKAFHLARIAADRSGSNVPLAGWIAGLSAWRKGEFKTAATYFEMAGISPYADGWTASAGSYWAARAHMRTGEFKKVPLWLEKAASYHRTFYGLIATRALGQELDMNWQVSALSEKHKDLIREYKSGWRALALLDIGEIEIAEKELIHLNPGRSNKPLRFALMALAQSYKMPALSYRLGNAYKDGQGRIHEAGLYPLMSWEPRSGYTLDRALIHAFIRQESRFDVDAQSHTGATGLMQLMLRTASYVDGQRTFRAHNRHLLEHPSTNLDLGQKYIHKLLSYKQIQGDLLSLAVAYNAGPGNLVRWKKNTEISSDPLLFIESVPMRETRAFVERVLSNFWIYRMRLNQQTPSLTDIAQNEWPIYRDQEKGGIHMASIN